MAFWLAVLGGALFVWIAIGIRFYETWILLFNIVISVYVAVFLAPIIAGVVPAAGGTPYGHALTLMATAVGVLLVLYAISYTFLTSQVDVSFPKICENLAAGVLGFLAGFLAFSFAAFLICLTPLREHSFVDKFGLGTQSQQANRSYIGWWCDVVNLVVSSDGNELTGKEALSELLKRTQPKAEPETGKHAEQRKPVESKNSGAGTEEENGPASPPDTDPGDT